MSNFNFTDEIHYFQKFVRDNINLIGNLSIISEQTYVNNGGKKFIDILCIDHSDNRLVILELKNNFTKTSILSQVLEYYDGIVKVNRDSLDIFLKENNISLDNYVPKIKIVVPDFDSRLLNQLSYLSLDIEVIKIYIKTNEGFFETNIERYIPQCYQEKSSISINNNVVDNFEEYLKLGVYKEQIELCKSLLNYMKLRYGSDINYFLYKNKVSVLNKNKVILHINFIKNNLSKNILLNIPNKNLINEKDLVYCGDILNIKFLKNSTKVEITSIPNNLLSNIKI